ncbi:synapsin-like isoform X1 [Mytilus trossulus]|uniref:synapsin-like isoform X1 n=1 Tax=Mytilus trossulus TaxID=6551 RepID=UPI003003BCB1
MNFLRRRFSSGDLQGELKEENSSILTFKKGPSPSAPSSPSKTLNATQGLPRAGPVQNSKPAYNKDRCKILLVVDDQHTDWSKYFRGRKIFGDWDIRVEQAEFKEINLASYSDTGTMVDIQVTRSGTKVVRSFKPDFLLIRQYVRDASEDWRSILIGFQYGDIPSINSLHSIYNFQDRPWVLAQLVKLQKKLGKENFPLIEQAYYPNHREMLITPKFPVVVKVGHAHAGAGKVRLDNIDTYREVAHILALGSNYATTEKYIDGRYDLHLQKIGNNYRAYMRKSISGNWKANTGSAMLEQIAMNEKFKLWVDECSQLFGGLDIMSVEAVQGKDGKEYIIEVNDSSMNLLGESQEEDRRNIGELVITRMQQCLQPVQTLSRTISLHYGMNGSKNEPVNPPARPPQPQQGQPIPQQSHGQQRPQQGQPIPRQQSQQGNVQGQQHQPSAQMQRQTSQTQQSSSQGHPVQHGTPMNQRPQHPQQQRQQQQNRTDGGPPGARPPPIGVGAPTLGKSTDFPEGEDTMKNLRKTFAGIFGDM